MSEYDEKMKAHRAREEAEAMSRRDEAVAMIHASKGIPDSEEVKRVTGDTRVSDAQKAYDTAGRDLSGSTAGLTDSRGNLAPDVFVGMAGGTGVEASNSVPGTDEQATDPDNAGEGGDRSSGAAGITIPDDWESLSFRERANIASQLSATGRQPRNGDEANEIIRAELTTRQSTA